MRKLLLGVTLVALVVFAAGCKLVVTPSAPNGWAFLNEGANGNGYFVNGPGDPPAGRGSAVLSIDGNGREAIAVGDYSGFALSTLTQLQYSTYQAYSGSPNETLTLAFDIDYDSTDNTTAYQGRLVYVPSAAATISPNTWQTWNTMSGAAWYSSATGTSQYRPIVNGVTQSSPPCTQASFCDWATVLSDYPHATIRPKVNNIPGALLVRAGGPVTGGFVGATDNVVIGIGTNIIENNFEPGDGNVVVKTSNAASLGFAFVQETPSGSGAFVSGPNGADSSGSAQLTTTNTAGGEALGTGIFAGTPLDQLDFLSYKTYQKTTAHAATLQVDVDYDTTDTNTSYQGRAVFEPSLSGRAVANEVWQTWNPLTASSGWWQSGTPIVGGSNGTPQCTQASPCSFSQLLADYPHAAIRPVTGQFNAQPIGGGIWFKAGSTWAGGFTGNVDSLTIALRAGDANGTVTYDFEQ
jgi:hypothetical protein